MDEKRTGIILVNLGTPKAPTARSVRQFLREFLSDPRVVEAPALPWKLVLNAIILPLRGSKVARLYQNIWTDNGSPLSVITKDQVAALQLSIESGELAGQLDGQKFPPEVVWAMTYGSPSIADQIDKLIQQNIKKILVLPLYPQYSSTTTAAVYDQLAEIVTSKRDIPDLRCIHDYHDHPNYIKALADSVRDCWHNKAPGDRLLISFHGLPKKYVSNGDPYINQCHTSASLLAEELELSPERWACTFQSRFGPGNWVEPYTDQTLLNWASEGVKNVDVICPGFAADCLETLEEIAIRARAGFIDAGGTEFSYISCLNSRPEHVALLEALVVENIW